MYDLLVSGGKIVARDRVYCADIAVSGGKIVAIGENLGEASQKIDAKGRYLFPGALDCHAHLNDPGFTWREDFEHGSLAAAAGGVTTIIDMPLQNEPALTDAEIFRKKQEAIASKALVDYAFWGGLVDFNLDKLAGLDEAGVLAFKVFIGPVSPDYQSLNMGLIREALQITKGFDGLIGFHAEDYSVIKHEEARAKKEGRAEWRDFLNSRPLIAEILSTQNVISLARETGARVHICHVSHPDVAELIRQAQHEGLPVTGETCTHYLVFSEDDVLKKGSLFKCAPPLRNRDAVERLWDYVLDGTLGSVASDHSPCTEKEKCEKDHGVFGAWGGISGIQSVMQVFFDQAVNKRGHCPSLLARRLSEDTARTFGIYGRKGALEVGFDADIVILDPDREWEITPESLFYLNPISAFVGLKGKGLAVTTIVRGTVVFDEGERKAEFGQGELIKKIKKQ